MTAPEEFPQPRRRVRRFVVGLFLGVLVSVLLVVGAAAFWYLKQVNPGGSAGRAVSVTIPLGSSTQRIAAILDARGVIGSAQAFRIYSKIEGVGPFQAGEYEFRRHSSFGTVVSVLAKGPHIKYEKLTVPEGLTVGQIAERIGKLPGRSSDAFLAAVKSGVVRSAMQPADSSNLEGLLLPETYNVQPRDNEDAILRRMVKSFDQACTEVGCQQAQEKVGLSPYQVVIVASMIERETRFDDERAKVAEVIYNRLSRGQPLGIDATVIYALGKSAEHNVRVLDSDLKIDSPYNTYLHAGLPPTPIAAPGKASLEAALNPEKGPFLYYVVTETDGHHSFATTAAEHAANIRKAQANGVR